MELATVPSLSLKKIQQLQDALGISSIAELKAAAEQGKISTVKGFGVKTEKKLLEASGQEQSSATSYTFTKRCVLPKK